MTSKVKTFFEDIGHWFKELFGSTTWEKQLLSMLRYAAPLITEIATLIGGAAAGAAVQSVLTQIQSGFATLASLSSGAVAAQSSNVYQTALNELNLLKSNLAQLLTVADIKDAALQQKITGYVNTIVAELDAAIESIPQSLASATTATS